MRSLLPLGLVVVWAGTTLAQTGANEFLWKFTTEFSTSVDTCQSLALDIVALQSNSSSFGVPPYYMIAWPAGGTPTVSLLGSNRSGLSYTVNQPAGSKVLFTVADSEGNSGGESGLYDIESGDTSCLPSNSSANFTLGANVTDQLETCQPLGLRVYGGQGPYNLSFAAAGSPVVTNVTMDEGDDVFTWPNRADPKGQLIVSVVDATGVWGTSTGIFNTFGSNETGYCPINPTSGKSSEVDQHPPQPSNSKTTTIVVAVVVPVVVIALLAILGFLLLRRKKRRTQAPEAAIMPDAWTGPTMTEFNAGAAGDRGSYNPYDPPPSSKLARFRDDYGGSQSGYSRSDAGGMLLAPGMSPRRSSFDAGESTFSGAQGGPPGHPEVIYHRDAGAVQEIPPPYIDRAGDPAGSSSQLAPPELAAAATSITSSPEPLSSDSKQGYIPENRSQQIQSPPISRSPPTSTDMTSSTSTPTPGGRPSSSGSTYRSLPEPPRNPSNSKGKGKEVLLS